MRRLAMRMENASVVTARRERRALMASLATPSAVDVKAILSSLSASPKTVVYGVIEG